jgi:WhiB family redox-sensing transcriptional regulator
MTAAPTEEVLDFADVAKLLLPVLEPEPDSDWKNRGQCRQVDPDSFFPEKGGSAKDAKRVCRSCPVRLQCLEFALENDERFGVWGGLSERERRRVKRETGPANLRAVS